jgi:hypothetical protein
LDGVLFRFPLLNDALFHLSSTTLACAIELLRQDQNGIEYIAFALHHTQAR